MKPKPIKEVLSNYLKGSNFKEINETIGVHTLWKTIAGELIDKNTEIISFKSGKLNIKTSNPIWRNELSLQKIDLLKKLKKAEPELKIDEIIFR
jgi:hypothetical protein